MARTVALGEQNFSQIIKYECFYVDKTDFIKEWWENRDTVTLITRPRRFGKTLAMDMLYEFFSMERKGSGALFQKISADMDDAVAALSLGQLSRCLYKHYGKKVIILLDEYDAPMQETYVNGCWKELTEFLRGLFNSAFKINPFLERAMMTGIRGLLGEYKLKPAGWKAGAARQQRNKDHCGGSAERKRFCTIVDEQIVFHELDYDQNAIWSLLLAGGYLKITGYEVVEPELGREGTAYHLALTNLEMVVIFRKMIRGWFALCSSSYNDFIRALLENDLESMNAYMNQVALALASSFDSGNKPSEKSEPERFYHGLVLGLMVDLSNRYIITSNRESGFGKYDVLLEPRNYADDGIIFEFKVSDARKEKSMDDTAKTAICQIIDRKYAACIEGKCGRDRIRVYGFAFREKEVLIQGGWLREYLRE